MWYGFLLIIALILLGVAAIWFLTTVSIAPWVPTRKRDLQRFLELADLKEGETFYDLGCGTGTTVFYVARHTQAKAVGVEMSFPLIVYCHVRRLVSGLRDVKIKYKNAYKVDLSDADVIYIFGMSGRFKKMMKKLKSETKEGTRLISYAFKIDELQPIKVDKPSDKDLPIYLYEL